MLVEATESFEWFCS